MLLFSFSHWEGQSFRSTIPQISKAFANLLFIREDREDIEIFPKSFHVATKIKINLFCDPPDSHHFRHPTDEQLRHVEIYIFFSN